MLDFGFYSEDCLPRMKEYPDKWFELAIVDPPYGIGADRFNNGAGLKDHSKGSTAKRLNKGSGKLKNRMLNKSDCSWDKHPPSKEYFDELFRISKNQIIWGGNYFDLPPTRGIAVWDKQQPWENFSQVEIAWTSFDTPAKIFRYCNAGGASGSKIHPTQKPVELYEWLLTKYAKDGDKILDTHVGSASSLIACYNLGFDYVGFEINEGYYKSATERLKEAMAQLRWF